MSLFDRDRNAAKSRGIGGHTSPVLQRDHWLTPPEILRELGPFDLDPCAAPEPRPWPTAREHYTSNGLSLNWHGRVWLNPPYGRHTGKWLDRLAAHGNGVAITFARTETEMFFESVWRKASSLLFLRGRLHFHHLDGTRAKLNAGGPSVLISYDNARCTPPSKAGNAMRLRECGLDGWWVPL